MCVKRLIFILTLFVLCNTTTAHADWRWAKPKDKKQYVMLMCDSMQCAKVAQHKARVHYEKKIRRYNRRKLAEWQRVTSAYIPVCTWNGESGSGPQYARYRYRVTNTSSGAYGKFQFMPSTYFSVGRYKDWSPLDQEIAARREYRSHGTSPWANC